MSGMGVSPNGRDISLLRNEDVGCCYRAIASSGLRVVWEITSSCNLACRHCFRTAPEGHDLDTARALSLVDEMIAAGVRKIAITGGEPLLRPDLTEITARLRSAGLLVKLASNLTMIDPDTARGLSEAGYLEVGFSLDGPDATTHDYIRGHGAYARLVAAVGMLSSLQTVQLNPVCVLGEFNADRLDEIVERALTWGAASVTFSDLFLIDSPRVLAPREFVMAERLDTHAREAALTRIVELRRLYPEIAIRTVALSDESVACSAGTSVVHVDPTGRVNPCTLYHLDPPISVHELTFSEALTELAGRVFCEGTSLCRYLDQTW